MLTIHRRFVLLPLLLAAAVGAQDAATSVAQDAATSVAQDIGPPLDAETGLVRSVSELVVEPGDLKGGWFELTPLATEAPASLVRLGDRTSADVELRLRPEVPAGAAMLCTGADLLGVLCEQVYVQKEAWIGAQESLDVVVRFEPGLAVEGRYLLDGWPISGARVAVVPAGLTAARTFTMPLGLEPSSSRAPGPRREVSSDDDGRFTLPRLGTGEYFLETLLPSGRVHRSELFEVPDPDTMRRESGAAEEQVVVWSLGVIDVADGLVVEFQVDDLAGVPIAGATVAGRQGDTPASLINYQAVTDDEGVARLSGFSVESVRVSCRKDGYRTLRQDYPLLPVLVSCALEPLAAVGGEVLGIEGLPPPGAMVSVEAVAVEAASVEPQANAADHAEGEVPLVQVGPDGSFIVSSLAPGEYLLKAAAPGFEVETRTVVLEPGQRLELETIVLLHGRAIEGRVVDADSREPIVGVEIKALSPPGAVFEITDEVGEFTLATRTREVLVLSLAADGYAGREVTVTPKRLAEREPLLFEMERGGRIRALVFDEATGLPCQSCRLVIKSRSGGTAGSVELVTSSSGEAISEPLIPGSYRVYRPRVSHLGSTVISQDNAEYRHVRVRRGETSTVRFGEQRRTVRVGFRPPLGSDWTLSARTPSRTERYHAGPDGRFEVRHRSGESLDLFLHRYEAGSGAEVEVMQATVPGNFSATELVLPLARAGLRGRATQGGAPIAGAEIRLRTLQHATRAIARTHADGSFAIPHLPVGVYALTLGERSLQIVSLRATQTLDLGTFNLVQGSF